MLGPRLLCGVIDGKELWLVPTTKAHLPACVEWLADPEVTRFLSHGLAMSLEQEEEWWTQASKAKDKVFWSIELDKEHVGQADIHGIDDILHTGTTGIFLAKEYWRRGIATQVMRRRAVYAAEGLNLRGLYTEICIANEGSWKAAQKAGYVQWGLQPEAMFANGRYYDAWMGYLRLPQGER